MYYESPHLSLFSVMVRSAPYLSISLYKRSIFGFQLGLSCKDRPEKGSELMAQKGHYPNCSINFVWICWLVAFASCTPFCLLGLVSKEWVSFLVSSAKFSPIASALLAFVFFPVITIWIEIKLLFSVHFQIHSTGTRLIYFFPTVSTKYTCILLCKFMPKSILRAVFVRLKISMKKFLS